MTKKNLKLQWKVHTRNLFMEIIEYNTQTSILKRPMQMTWNLLLQVEEAAIRINDPELNQLMCRLTIYTMSDPEHSDYDPKLLEKVAKLAEEAQLKRIKFGDELKTNPSKNKEAK